MNDVSSRAYEGLLNKLLMSKSIGASNLIITAKENYHEKMAENTGQYLRTSSTKNLIIFHR